MIQSKAIYSPLLLGSLIGCMRLCRGVAMPKVEKSGHYEINGFPAISADSSLVAFKVRSTPVLKMIQSKVMYNSRLSVTLIGYLHLSRGVAKKMCDNQDIQGSMDSRPFRLIRPWFACKARSTPDPEMMQSKAIY